MSGYVDEGLRAFRRGAGEEAIRAWNEAAKDAPELRPALAEAYFRRALNGGGSRQRGGAVDRSKDLLAALEWAPGEGRFWYHLGLCRHRAGDLQGAGVAYQRAAERGFARRAALAFVQGVLALELEPQLERDQQIELDPQLERDQQLELNPQLERDQQLELDRQRGAAALDPEAQALLLPFIALLDKDWQTLEGLPPPAILANPKGTPAWPGLVQLFRGIGQAGLERWGEAIQTLGAIAPDRYPLPVEALRVLLLARALDGPGRPAEARKLRKAALARTGNPFLEAELLTGPQTQGQAAPVNPQAPVKPQTPVADLDGLARKAAGKGRWAEACRHWAALVKALEGGPHGTGLAAARHNLALGLERQEKWDAAADAWLACAAALPGPGAAAGSPGPPGRPGSGGWGRAGPPPAGAP